MLLRKDNPWHVVPKEIVAVVIAMIAKTTSSKSGWCTSTASQKS
jgi:hypothetical protein